MSIKQQSCVEAMKQALEALHRCSYLKLQPDSIQNIVNHYIPLIEQAIAEAEKQRDSVTSVSEVEPVAWIQKNDQGRLITITQEHLDSLQPEWQYIAGLWKDAKPLYTHPPQRRNEVTYSEDTQPKRAVSETHKWVGLTKAECLEIEKSMSKYYDYQHQCKTVCLPEFANAIEAKLKEKNT